MGRLITDEFGGDVVQPVIAGHPRMLKSNREGLYFNPWQL